VDAEGWALTKWQNDRTLGYFNTNPHRLFAPAPSYAARGLNDGHVTDLMKNFQRTGNTPMDIKNVIINDQLFAALREDQCLGNLSDAARPEDELDQLINDVDSEDPKPRPRAYCGNHSRVGVTNLLVDFPGSRTWGAVRSLIIVAEDNEETIRMLTMLGLVDNTKVVKLATFAGHVLGLHSRAFALGINAAKERMADIKADLEQSANLKPELVGH
jgi:hypothetical protein